MGGSPDWTRVDTKRMATANTNNDDEVFILTKLPSDRSKIIPSSAPSFSTENKKVKVLTHNFDRDALNWSTVFILLRQCLLKKELFHLFQPRSAQTLRKTVQSRAQPRTNLGEKKLKLPRFLSAFVDPLEWRKSHRTEFGWVTVPATGRKTRRGDEKSLFLAGSWSRWLAFVHLCRCATVQAGHSLGKTQLSPKTSLSLEKSFNVRRPQYPCGV